MIDFDDIVKIDKNLGNATPERIVDELGVLRDMAKRVGAKEKFLTGWLKNHFEKTGECEFSGETYNGKAEVVCQERISATLAREKLSEEQIAEITSVIEFSKLTIKPKKR